MRQVLKPFATRDGTRPLNQLSALSALLSYPFFPRQWHPLSLQRFTTLRDYLKKARETRDELLYFYRCLRIMPKPHCCKIFFTLFCVHLKGPGFLSFPRFFSIPDIGARSTVRRIVYLLKYAEQRWILWNIVKARNFYDNGCENTI